MYTVDNKMLRKNEELFAKMAQKGYVFTEKQAAIMHKKKGQKLTDEEMEIYKALKRNIINDWYVIDDLRGFYTDKQKINFKNGHERKNYLFTQRALDKLQVNEPLAPEVIKKQLDIRDLNEQCLLNNCIAKELISLAQAKGKIIIEADDELSGYKEYREQLMHIMQNVMSNVKDEQQDKLIENDITRCQAELKNVEQKIKELSTKN